MFIFTSLPVAIMLLLRVTNHNTWQVDYEDPILGISLL